MTIDPATARDHDDAVCVERSAGRRLPALGGDRGRRAFVAEGGALDREALRRGNSVYFPDRAIPMLPERLSGELCSLRPGVDRLVLAVELTLDARGAISGARFHEAVIRSRARLVYDAAARGHGRARPSRRRAERRSDRAAPAARRAGAAAFEAPLRSGRDRLRSAERRDRARRRGPPDRHRRGAAHAGAPRDRGGDAAREPRGGGALVAAEVPALYRVHEAPTPTALAGLRALLDGFGLLDLPRDAPLGAREIAAAVQRAVAPRGAARPLHGAALDAAGALRRACLGHFALAFDAYLHFTSPIRRYADLVVHRALRDTLTGRRRGACAGAGASGANGGLGGAHVALRAHCDGSRARGRGPEEVRIHAGTHSATASTRR